MEKIILLRLHDGGKLSHEDKRVSNLMDNDAFLMKAAVADFCFRWCEDNHAHHMATTRTYPRPHTNFKIESSQNDLNFNAQSPSFAKILLYTSPTCWKPFRGPEPSKTGQEIRPKFQPNFSQHSDQNFGRPPRSHLLPKFLQNDWNYNA